MESLVSTQLRVERRAHLLVDRVSDDIGELVFWRGSEREPGENVEGIRGHIGGEEHLERKREREWKKEDKGRTD